VKLQPRTLQILKNFATVNPSLLFKKGHQQATVHPMKALLVAAAIEEEIPADFAIYDLSRFIGTLSLFVEPELIIQKKCVSITEKGQKVNYTFADQDQIITPKVMSMKLPSEDIKFKLEAVALNQLIKAAAVLSLPQIVVVGDGSTISIGADKCKDPSADKYMVEVGLTKHVFRLAFELEHFRVLPGTYNVTLTKEGIGHFQAEDIQYWITTVKEYNRFE
jgi:hypothetical protein